MRKCRGCGADVPNNAPFGHCPKCLLELGFGPLPEAPDAPPPAPAPAGARRFGDYELLDQIGRGGMGVIYKARQVTLNRLVALKMIRAAEFASPTLIQRFHLEAEAAAGLHHPNIVPIYETGEHEGEHFFSMELVDGFALDRYITTAGFCFDRKADGDSESVVARREPSVGRASSRAVRGEDKPSVRARQEQIARLMAKVARAVDYAHQHGVLHRDLKPGNILLDRQGEPYLTDFGVAKLIGQSGISLTVSGSIMGTPSYMAPEQAAGQSKRVTTAADIYSLGAILYEMLTGQPPFRADTPVETLKQVIEQEPKHPTTFKEGVDRDLATISMKCLEKEPQRRYPSAVALSDDLERWLGREPIHARPVNTAERVWRWCRRNPKVAALGGAVALLLVLLTLGSIITAIVFAGQRSVIRQEVTQGLVDVFMERKLSYEVSSPMRRALTSGILSALKRAGTRRETKTPSAPALELTVVLHPYGYPTNMLETFSPILNALEDRLTESLGRPVAINLRMFSNYRPLHQAIESDELTFARMGPASYISLLEKGTGVSLLAMQNHKNPLTLAIFTRKDSDIAKRYNANTNTPLAELLKNRSVALGDTNSTTGYHVACWYLVEKGIYATNLASYAHFAGQQRVIDAVRNRTNEAGAGTLDLVDDDPELLVIAKYPLPGNLGLCWVAGKRLETNITAQLRDCLLKIKDKRILSKLESEVMGFKTPDEEAFEWILGETRRKTKPFFKRPPP